MLQFCISISSPSLLFLLLNTTFYSTTYRPETTLNYGLERAWCIAATKDANKIAIGYDEGTVVLKLGNEKPVASLDTNSGEFLVFRWCLFIFNLCSFQKIGGV